MIIAKADVNETDLNKNRPLLLCARHNENTEIIQMLLKNDALYEISDS